LIRDDTREEQLGQVVREIEELEAGPRGAEATVRLISLTLVVGTERNELRQYATSADWARRALTVLRDAALPLNAEAMISLRARDLLITSLANMNEWSAARTEFDAQMKSLRAASGVTGIEADSERSQIVERMWLHIGRLRRESDVKVEDLEEELQHWNDSRVGINRRGSRDA
jgi:hypothetical protein